jgi:hypothetical protein
MEDRWPWPVLVLDLGLGTCTSDGWERHCSDFLSANQTVGAGAAGLSSSARAVPAPAAARLRLSPISRRESRAGREVEGA